MTTNRGMMLPSQLATMAEVESTLLCELVDGLTATRTEQAVRATIDSWKNRVHAAGLDSDRVLAAFREARSVETPWCDDAQRWADPDKREFVLACVAVYVRGRES